MKTILISFLLSVCLFGSCRDKLTFAGNNFLTLEGNITDTLGKPVANLPVSLNAALERVSALSPQSGPVKVASAVTHEDGSFRLIFPASNGYLYVLLPNPYKVADSTGADTLSYNHARISFTSFSNGLYNMDTIKIVAQ